MRQCSSSDVALRKRKRKAEADKARNHGKSGERNGRAVSCGGCCVRGSGRSVQKKLIGSRHGFGYLWATMREWEVNFCDVDGRCMSVRRRAEKDKRIPIRVRKLRTSPDVGTADRQS